MKTPHLLPTAVTLLVAALTARAQLSIPSDGSDGELTVTADTVIDLRTAVTGRWDASNAAHAGQGIYDPEKWAVVFKYSAVSIQAKVTFANHPTHAPVVWLVQGDVDIAGEINVSGQTNVSGIEALIPREPGPGGFRGGATGPQGGGGALGPGFTSRGFGLHASAYGNPQIVPLIGGAGGPVATPAARAAAGRF
jgi:hypothetical protein